MASQPDPAALLGAVASALAACDDAGLKVKLKHGIVITRHGYVLPVGDQWVARTLPTPSSATGAATMTTEAPKPSTGRIVHYVSHGTPVQPDGSQAFTSECRAAIVTEVMDDPLESVGLCVMNPTGQFFNRAVPHDEDEHGGGTWHWPERAGSRQITEPAPAHRAEILEN